MSELIGDVAQLEDGGVGLRFDVKHQGELIPAFAIRFDGVVAAYLNRCGHIAIPLDYNPGSFFSDDKQTLVCSTHGAEYAPNTGQCLGGPCYGVWLDPLPVSEQEGKLYLESTEYEVIRNHV